MGRYEFALGVITAIFSGGGVLGIWVQSRFKAGREDAVPATEVHATDVTRALAAADLPAAWSTLAGELQQELRSVRLDVAELNRARDRDARTITLLYGYGHTLRSQLVIAGHTPESWPPDIDPNRPTTP